MKPIFERMLATTKKLIRRERPINADTLRKEADAFFSELQAERETSSLSACLLCWCFYASAERKSFALRKYENQEQLQRLIIKKALCTGEATDIYQNEQIRTAAKKEFFSLTNGKHKDCFAFITYCMYRKHENVYWQHINCAILNHVYAESLNNLKKWRSGDTIFEPPLFTEAEIVQKKRLPASIDLADACTWVHLDYVLTVPMRERSRSIFPDDPEHVPDSLRAFDLLMQLTFSERYKQKTKAERTQIARFVFSGLFFLWLYNGDSDSPKTMALGFFESKPGILYCFYKVLHLLDKADCDYFFPSLPDGDLRFEKNRFIAMWGKEENETFPKIPSRTVFEFAMYCFGSEKAFSDDPITDEELDRVIHSVYASKLPDPTAVKMAREKAYPLQLMFYFLLWDFASRWNEFIPNADHTENLAYKQHETLVDAFLEPFFDMRWANPPSQFDDDWNEFQKTQRMQTAWTDEKTLTALCNAVLSAYHANNTIAHIDFAKINHSVFSTSVILKTLLCNLSDSDGISKDQMLHLMDFVGEQKDRLNFYYFPQKNQYYVNEEDADDEIKELQTRHAILQNIDKGFEISNYIQYPAPGFGFRFHRNITCKFFNDTDKVYRYDTEDVGKKGKKFQNRCTESYRSTNRNNFRSHYLYAAERNTDRHYTSFVSLKSILDGTHPERLLEAFIDARDFLLLQKQERTLTPMEKLIVEYQLQFINIHTFWLAHKLQLPFSDSAKEKDYDWLWESLYTHDKSVKVALPESIDYEKLLGKQYLYEVEWFFKQLYCVDTQFVEKYSHPIAVYLIYVSLMLAMESART